jgi:energy-coupling factor transport system substrate-specific component
VVEQVVTTALAKDPKQRFSSVLAFANALQQASESEQATHLEPQPPKFAPPAVESPIASSPFPPMHHAKDSQLQGVRLSVGDNASTVEGPANKHSDIQLSTHQEPLPQTVIEGKSNKKHIWQLGGRQVLSMFVGTLLSAALFYFVLTLGNALSFSLFFVGVSVVLFCGVVFGPWVGLITGGVGLGTSWWLYLSVVHFQLPLWIFLSIALAGFVAGLVWLQTQGIYNTRRSRVLAEVYYVLGLVIAISSFLVFIIQLGSNTFNLLLYGLIGAIPGLIFLPIFLTLSASSTKRQG